MARLLDQIKGHATVIQNLLEMNAKFRLHPVLLFIGPSGVGKKKVALGLAQALVCEKTPNACGICGPCLRIEKNSSESLKLLQPQGAQIKIEQTRELQDWLSLRALGKARVVILDDADKLNVQAANSLLKTLEEPGENVFFILIAQSQNSLLTTIRSRAQTVRFGALGPEDLQSLTGAPAWAVISSQGQLNRLSSLLTPEYETFRKSWLEVFMSIQESDKRSWAFTQVKELASDRETALQMVSLWQQFVRDISFMSVGLEPIIHADRMNGFKEFSHLSGECISELNQCALQAERDLNGNIDRGIVLENLWWQSQKSMARSRHDNG